MSEYILSQMTILEKGGMRLRGASDEGNAVEILVPESQCPELSHTLNHATTLREARHNLLAGEVISEIDLSLCVRRSDVRSSRDDENTNVRLIMKVKDSDVKQYRLILPYSVALHLQSTLETVLDADYLDQSVPIDQ